MKLIKLMVVSSIVLLSGSVPTPAIELEYEEQIISQTNINIVTPPNGQTQATMIMINRADLRQPYLIKVQGSMNDAPIKMAKVAVKINGKVVKSIVNSSLELNLSPLMTKGRYEVEISGTSPQRDNTISVNFTGRSTSINQQFSGSGTINQTLIVNVR